MAAFYRELIGDWLQLRQVLPTVSCPGEPDEGDRGGEQRECTFLGGPSLTGHVSDDAELVLNQPR